MKFGGNQTEQSTAKNTEQKLDVVNKQHHHQRVHKAEYNISNSEDLKLLEDILSNQMYVHGHHSGSEDALLFNQWLNSKSEPNREIYPTLWSWFTLISLYNPAVLEHWLSIKPTICIKNTHVAQAKSEKKFEGKVEEPKESKPTNTTNQVDDCDDLFADETDEEIKKREELESRRKAEKESKDKDKKPKVVIAKSLVIIDIKVWDMEQDLDKLAKKVISEIVMDGLTWKTEYKLIEVAFGIKKIRIGLVVEDAKVSVDDIIDILVSWYDDVQSVDIVSFDKI